MIIVFGSVSQKFMFWKCSPNNHNISNLSNTTNDYSSQLQKSVYSPIYFFPYIRSGSLVTEYTSNTKGERPWLKYCQTHGWNRCHSSHNFPKYKVGLHKSWYFHTRWHWKQLWMWQKIKSISSAVFPYLLIPDRLSQAVLEFFYKKYKHLLLRLHLKRKHYPHYNQEEKKGFSVTQSFRSDPFALPPTLTWKQLCPRD